jgi:hypothetical protein
VISMDFLLGRPSSAWRRATMSFFVRAMRGLRMVRD